MNDKTFTPSPEYRAAWGDRKMADMRLSLASRALKDTKQRLAKSQGGPEKGQMGLTNDAIKSTLDWQRCHIALERARDAARKAGQSFIQNHKSEYARHRKASANPYKPTL